jgi:hypothetical protein
VDDVSRDLSNPSHTLPNDPRLITGDIGYEGNFRMHQPAVGLTELLSTCDPRGAITHRDRVWRPQRKRWVAFALDAEVVFPGLQ